MQFGRREMQGIGVVRAPLYRVETRLAPRFPRIRGVSTLSDSGVLL
jgi:hypothetical protein